MTGVRVLVVDDHEGFLAAVSAMLAASGYEVVSTATDGESALVAIPALSADVVLVDLQLPGIDGVEVAHRINAMAGAPGVILVSSREDAGSEPRVAAAPALGFLAKRDLTPDAIDTLLA